MSQCPKVIASVGECRKVIVSVGECRRVIVRVGQVLDSDSECKTVPDSASEHGIDTMVL